MSPVALAIVGLVVIVAVSIVVVALAAYARLGDRRQAREVRDRLAELEQLPAPDELPQAPDPTRSMRRAHTRRDHPIAHKRSGRGW